MTLFPESIMAPPPAHPVPTQPLLPWGLPAVGTVALMGRVDKVLSERPSGWRMILVDVQGSDGTLDRKMKWMGVMDAVAEDSLVQATGRLEEDRRDAGTEIFVVDAMIEQVPQTTLGLQAFISRLVAGVGKGRARLIVERFGPMTVEILDKDPARLAEVNGITPERAGELAKAWATKRASAAVTLLLLNHGVKPHLARKIAEHFEDRAQWVVENDPYRLTEVEGIAFATADAIAKSINVDPYSPKRAQAAIFEILNQQTFARGHCYSAEADVVARARAMIEVPLELVTAALDALADAPQPRIWRQIFAGEPVVMLPAIAGAEQRMVQKIARIAREPLAPNADDHGAPLAGRVDAAIAAFERSASITLAPMQREAIAIAAKEKVLVLTGGPGTGKSTLLKGILFLFKSAGIPVHLCAPTGRAAKRMNEATGQMATTIHRLLVFQPEHGDFLYREGAPIPDCGVVICDEASMADQKLAADLLAAIPPGARLIIIGDVDQLPSVGPGVVLRHLIASKVLPVVRLTQIFRQAEGSAIIDNAHRINAGRAPIGQEGSGKEVYVIKRSSGAAAARTVVQLVTRDIPEKFGILASEIQVLTPMHKMEAGSIALNTALQAALNPAREGELEVKRSEVSFRAGDKVLHKKNDPQRDVYNGDLGVIARIFKDESGEIRLTVAFDERRIVYTAKQVKDLRLAYAMSVHSAQGASFTAVVQVLMWEHHLLLSRPLLYTGFTRPRKLAILITEDRALRKALGDTESVRRRSRLKALLQSALG